MGRDTDFISPTENRGGNDGLLYLSLLEPELVQEGGRLVLVSLLEIHGTLFINRCDFQTASGSEIENYLSNTCHDNVITITPANLIMLPKVSRAIGANKDENFK